MPLSEKDGIHRRVETRFGPLLYDPSDIPVGRSLDVYGEWGESEVEVLAQVLRPGDTVVDVGAGIGTHTLFFAKSVGPMGRVLAFEPLEQAYLLLEANIELNALSVVTPEQLSLDAGVRSLDSRELASCRLLKIDVDGAELDVLQGSRDTLGRLAPIVFVENNDSARSAQLIAYLLELEYKLYWHLDFAFRKNNARGHETDIFNGAFDVNVLGLPPKIRPDLKNFTAVVGPSDTWQAALERSKLTE